MYSRKDPGKFRQDVHHLRTKFIDFEKVKKIKVPSHSHSLPEINFQGQQSDIIKDSSEQTEKKIFLGSLQPKFVFMWVC